MKYLRISHIFSFFTAMLISQGAFSAAFQLYELGTPIIGTAGVGQAAVVTDASISYFNPAGMAELARNQFMLGSQLIVPVTQFSPNTQNTISGGNGGEAATLTPGMALYYVYSYSPDLKFGVSFNSPYGGLLTYTDGWVGRYLVQNTQFYTLNLNPSVAYRINPWASVGGGVAVEYANLFQSVAFPLPVVLPPPINTLDGQATVKVHNTAVGFNIGVLLTPTVNTKLGMAYRSKITHDLKGTTTFLRTSDQPNTQTKMIMPQNVILSLNQQATNKIKLLGEVGWANWSDMNTTIVTLDGLSATTILDWNNTYRAGVAAQYSMTPAVLLQAGLAYDSSPTKSSLRTPDLPMDRQVRAGIGMIYSVMQMIKIGFSYEYIDFGNADINNVSSNGVMAGSYSKNYANVLQASINVMC